MGSGKVGRGRRDKREEGSQERASDPADVQERWKHRV